MRPATRTRWDSDPSWADIARRVPRVARLLERVHGGPTIRSLVRALFLDRLDDAYAAGRNVGDVARELGIGRRTAWRWIREMERETVPERPLRTGEGT